MYSMRSQRLTRKRPRFRLRRFLLVILVIGLLFNYIRPLPHANASITPLEHTPETTRLAWPSQGSAAVGAKGYGVLAAHGDQSQAPTASIAKLVTVLAVLEKHPLTSAKRSPILTMDTRDVALFNQYFSQGGAYVKVELSEKISQYQAMQAILLPSANNMADSLAIWAFGSIPNYITYANNMVKRLGLADTVIATDASGMSPDTVSTPKDLVKLGEIALSHSVIAEIISQPSAVIPVHGVIYSANSRLGYDNIIGIKTGLTDEAGGCFLFAAKHTLEGKSATIVGVVRGAPTLPAALSGSVALANSAKNTFSIKTPIKAGEAFGTLTTAWSETSRVIAKQDLSLLAWRGVPLKPHITLADINRSLPAGSQVGTAIVSSGLNKATTPLILEKSISGPSWQWRMKRF